MTSVKSKASPPKPAEEAHEISYNLISEGYILWPKNGFNRPLHFRKPKELNIFTCGMNGSQQIHSFWWWNCPLQDPAVQNLQQKLEAALQEIADLKGGSSTTNTPSPGSRTSLSTPGSALTSPSNPPTKGSKATRIKYMSILIPPQKNALY